MSLNNLQADIVQIAGVIGAAFFIGASIYKIYKVAHRVEAAIGTDKDGRTLSDRMNRVEHQLWQNGGDSLADKVYKTNSKVEEAEKQIRETAAEVRVIRQMLTVMMNNRSNSN